MRASQRSGVSDDGGALAGAGDRAYDTQYAAEAAVCGRARRPVRVELSMNVMHGSVVGGWRVSRVACDRVHDAAPRGAFDGKAPPRTPRWCGASGVFSLSAWRLV